jgi:predicted nucleic acid-binding protein
MNCTPGFADPNLTGTSSLDDRERLLRDFNACAVWVEAGEPGLFYRERDDDHFIEAALKAQAHCLVSGDKDLLEAPEVLGLRILSVHQALDLLTND